MHESIAAVLAAHEERVRAWLRNEPGAWGYLAGQAVLTERRRLGRPLTEPERRAVWQSLWNALLGVRAQLVDDGQTSDTHGTRRARDDDR
jgi:hypothetical protein